MLCGDLPCLSCLWVYDSVHKISQNVLHQSNKKLRGFDPLIVKMADNNHIKLDNIQI